MSRNRQTDNSVLQLLNVLRVGGASPAGTRCDRRSGNPPSLPDAFRPVECPVDAKVDAALAVLLFRGQCGTRIRNRDTCRAQVHPRRSRAGVVSNAAETTANPQRRMPCVPVAPLLSSLRTIKLTAAALRDISLNCRWPATSRSGIWQVIRLAPGGHPTERTHRSATRVSGATAPSAGRHKAVRTYSFSENSTSITGRSAARSSLPPTAGWRG